MFRGRNDGNPVGNPRQNLSYTREICPGLRDDAAQKPVHPLSLSGGGLSWLYPNVRLMSGMPAEVFIDLGSSSLLHMFFQPMIDSFNRSFRET